MIPTGLLGGSFNPAHYGHRRISLQAIEALGLEELWWLVSPGNPLKAESKDMAPYEARLASAERVARNSRIHASDFERVEGTRFTIDTLTKLKRRFPQHRFIWLMGSDALPNFHFWKDWREIAHLVPIAVIFRPGYDWGAHAARAMGWLRWFVHPSSQAKHWTEWSLPAILLLRLPPDQTSATAIRALDPNWHLRSGPIHVSGTSFGMPLSPRRPLDRTSR